MLDRDKEEAPEDIKEQGSESCLIRSCIKLVEIETRGPKLIVYYYRIGEADGSTAAWPKPRIIGSAEKSV